jgi:hypothetical protein
VSYLRAVVLVALLPATAAAASYRGMAVEQVLEELRAGGLEILYSSDLVKPWMRVEREPRAIEPQALLAEILAPHGIALAHGPANTLMLVRPSSASPRRAAPGRPESPAPAPLDAVVVSASHYFFGDETPFRPMVLEAAELEALPDIGEDPVRALARLPGVAGQDFSSRMHLRGTRPCSASTTCGSTTRITSRTSSESSAASTRASSATSGYTPAVSRLRSAIAAAAWWTSRHGCRSVSFTARRWRR